MFVIQPFYFPTYTFQKEKSQWQPSLYLKTYQPVRNRKCTCYKIFKNLQSVLLFLFIGQPQISHILSKISYTILLYDKFKKKKQLQEIWLKEGIYVALNHWHHLTHIRTEFCNGLYQMARIVIWVARYKPSHFSFEFTLETKSRSV